MIRDAKDVGLITMTLYELPKNHKSQYGDFQFEIPQRFIDQMIDIAKQYHPNETCGIIMGSYIANKSIALATSLINKSRDNKPHSCQFHSDCQKDADKIWDITDKKEYIIGDWHSHPGLPARPSVKDDENVFKGDINETVIVIVGKYFTKNDIGVFLYIKPDTKIEMIKET